MSDSTLHVEIGGHLLRRLLSRNSFDPVGTWGEKCWVLVLLEHDLSAGISVVHAGCGNTVKG